MLKEKSVTPKVHGMVAEFDQPEQLLAAALRARDEGYKRMDAYSPFPVHGLAEAINFTDNRLPWLIFGGGVSGAAAGFLLQWLTMTIDYPLNVGGRPLNSWPQFIPVTFEVTILLSSFAAVFGMLILNNFPEPHHPIFNAKNFDRASQDRFFLCIEANDERFEPERTRRFLERLGPIAVSEVEN